eukprot:TRINITY_DN2453_c1_g1_i6.p1 TRINITY_DN2453_c1_g1~~TRINITY_DN2453_c1_g1_i6.p1  ORF type:complete len:470 (-),score=169.93 TRINITY_DN2453_c1_g1_i6:79-1488(-)
MLNQTNIGNNNNKFYVIQLLERDNKSDYVLWTRWGRVGNTGQHKEECWTSNGPAKAAFRKKFREKTGNDFEDGIENFQKVAGKYAVVEVAYESDDEEEEKKKEIKKQKVDNDQVKKKGPPPTNLEKSVVDLVKLICDVEQMKMAMKEYSIDMQKMPLGKLSKKQILKGFEILKEIEEFIKTGAQGKNNKFIDFSNQFYTIIPHNFGMKVPEILNDLVRVKNKREMLEMLVDLEIAGKMLSKDEDEPLENPVDLHYRGLKSEIMSVDPNDAVYNTLERYVANTHGPTHTDYKLQVLDIFTVDREGQNANFKSMQHRQLLWHGSRLTNWVGILSQGLRIAPPEAPVTGYMFGKGVYFADMATKSANYCHASKQNPTGILLLCEVSLGNMLRKTQAEMIQKLPAGYDSCMGEGQWVPDPKDSENLPDGTVVPLGKPSKLGPMGTALLYNEFIVYDTAQIRVRYLLKVRFNYK